MNLTPEWLGRVAYADGLQRQRARRDAVLAGAAGEAFWLLEHDAVVTVGRREAAGVNGAHLEAAGVEVVRTERGGLATWHGPGQLVGYLIVDCGRRGWSIRGFVRALEGGVIRWLASVGVAAHRRSGHPGVWVEDEKLCALGLHFRRGVSLHGFALNLDPPANAFEGIIPCGLVVGRPGSVFSVSGRRFSSASVALQVGAAVWDTVVDEAGHGR